MTKFKKAQSTLEYIIVFTAIVGVVLLVTNTIIKDRMKRVFDRATGQAESAVDKIRF